MGRTPKLSLTPNYAQQSCVDDLFHIVWRTKNVKNINNASSALPAEETSSRRTKFEDAMAHRQSPPAVLSRAQLVLERNLKSKNGD